MAAKKKLCERAKLWKEVYRLLEEAYEAPGTGYDKDDVDTKAFTKGFANLMARRLDECYGVKVR